MTYDEWINSLTDEQKAAFETNVKMYKNRSGDKKQYENYARRLGAENVPKTFDLWQDLKYNRVGEYEDLKGFYRYKGNNSKASLNDYHCAKELQELGVKGSIHIPSTEIDVKSLIFNDEHINQQRKHGVKEQEAKEYISNALVSIRKRNGLTENYFAKEGAAYVNPIEKKIMTAFKANEFKGDAIIITEVLKRYGY